LIHDELKSKNPALRIKLAEYLYHIFKLWYPKYSTASSPE
jgi:hypothetical protein